MNKIRPIIEVYNCIQGEGMFMGIPHILIRFTGCRLRCEFEGSICDTAYASYKPDKGIFSFEMIEKHLRFNPQIKNILITGGEPLLHKDNLIKLISLIKETNKNYKITIETSGTDYFDLVDVDLISLSPKMSNSTPQDPKLKEIHEKYRNNFLNIFSLIDDQKGRKKNVQVKFVISKKEDLLEVEELIDKLKFISQLENKDIWLMPEGITDEQLSEKRKFLVEKCIEKGYNYTDRLQVIIYGTKRGV